MHPGSHKNTSEMITHYLKHATIGVLHCLELLGNQFRVQFTIIDHRLAGNLKQEVHFV